MQVTSVPLLPVRLGQEQTVVSWQPLIGWSANQLTSPGIASSQGGSLLHRKHLTKAGYWPLAGLLYWPTASSAKAVASPLQ